MSTPILDPSLPADHSPLSSGEMRGQFVELGNQINDTFNGSAANPADVNALGLTVSNPPTQAQVQAVANKLDELLAALKRS